MRTVPAAALLCVSLVTGCDSKPKPAPIAPATETVPAVPAPPPDASASAAPTASATVEPLACPPPDLASWAPVEPDFLKECKFRYAPHPEAIRLAARWVPCDAGMPAGCQRLDLPLEIKREAIVDASRDPARMLLTFFCGGVMTVVLDADGSPPKWAVESGEGTHCETRGVATDGKMVMAMLWGDVSDETIRRVGPKRSIVFSQSLGSPRVQHRLEAEVAIPDLVANHERWGNLASDGLYMAKLGEDRELAALGRDSHDQLRLVGRTAVFHAAQGYDEGVEGWSASNDESLRLNDVTHTSISALGLGPGGTVMWSEKAMEDPKVSCRLARTTAKVDNKVSRFKVPCAIHGEHWVISDHFAAVLHEGGRATIVRLRDNVATTLSWPCDKKGICHSELLALNDKELYATGYATARDVEMKTILRIPLPSLAAGKALEAVEEPKDIEDIESPDAGASADAGAAPSRAAPRDGGAPR